MVRDWLSLLLPDPVANLLVAARAGSDDRHRAGVVDI